MVLSLVLVLIGAIFGIVMLVALLQNKPTSKMSVDLHAVLTVVAFIILIAAASGAVVVPTLAIILLAVAAVGGLILFVRDRQNKPLPRTLGIFNPIVTALGALALLVFVAGGPTVDTVTGDDNRARTPGTVTPGTTAPGIGTGTSGMGDTTGTRGTMRGNTGAEGMGGTTGTGFGRTTSPDSGRLDDDRNRPGTTGTSGIGRTGLDTTGVPAVPGTGDR